MGYCSQPESQPAIAHSTRTSEAVRSTRRQIRQAALRLHKEKSIIARNSRQEVIGSFNQRDSLELGDQVGQ